MKFKGDLAFPEADVFMVNQVSPEGFYQRAQLEAALRYVTNWQTAIDGGAHIGTFSLVMATRFDRVIAVEPSPDTFEALTWNLRDVSNVDRRNVALGATPGTVEMTLDPPNAERANTGARFVRPGGGIPVETIDSWALPSLGLLKLDVEGSEPAAIRGALDTIRRCQPIILYENKWLWSRHYGLPKTAVSSVLMGLGYRHLERVSRDEIWGPA